MEFAHIKDIDTLKQYLPGYDVGELPVLYSKQEPEHFSDRELLYKVLFDMKKDMTEMKKIITGMLENGEHEPTLEQTKALMIKDYDEQVLTTAESIPEAQLADTESPDEEDFTHGEVIEESLSLADKENEMIQKALKKHQGKRKSAARELGISERTLYRKIKEYNIKE